MSDDRVFDLVIIGGGISGLGIAAEAASHGFSVSLFERKTLSGATSANSLRIIHGGLRYLQQFDIPRLRESARAQYEILSRYPGHVDPLPCVTPLAKRGLKSRLPMTAAAFIYRALTDGLGEWRPVPRILGPEELRREIPVLANRAPLGAFSWWDALVRDPAAFAAEIAREARESGAELHENHGVSSVERQGGRFRVSLNGGSQHETVLSRCVVDASGPWLHRIKIEPPIRLSNPLLWCRAFNVLLRSRIDSQYGIGVETDERRLYFTLPRGEQGVLGTGYLPFDGTPESVSISDEEVRAFLELFNRAWPEAGVSMNDVTGVECGVLPTRGMGANGPELLGREEAYDDGGYISVVSTKYTTFRSQAKAVLRMASTYLS